MPRQAQGRPWGCGGGVTVLDAVERWCLHVMRMVQSCSDSDRDTISDLSEMSGLKRCKLKLRVTTFKFVCSVSRPSSCKV